MTDAVPHPPIALHLDVRIRECREDDLEALEWFGMFTPHREIFRDTWRRHRAGEVVMLVAEANRFPIAQAWIDLTRKAEEGAGLLWAVRVFPLFQGMGLGTRLLDACEAELAGRGFRWAEIGVEKENDAARRLYLRQGYAPWGEEHDAYEYTPPGWTSPVRVPVDQWILRKPLPPLDEPRER
jgi:ribosomal protein S18 acetylase RimI-like enzyme